MLDKLEISESEFSEKKNKKNKKVIQHILKF